LRVLPPTATSPAAAAAAAARAGSAPLCLSIFLQLQSSRRPWRLEADDARASEPKDEDDEEEDREEPPSRLRAPPPPEPSAAAAAAAALKRLEGRPRGATRFVLFSSSASTSRRSRWTATSPSSPPIPSPSSSLPLPSCPSSGPSSAETSGRSGFQRTPTRWSRRMRLRTSTMLARRSSLGPTPPGANGKLLSPCVPALRRPAPHSISSASLRRVSRST